MPMGHHVCTMDNFRGDNASDVDAVTALVVVDAPGAPEGEGETASLRQIAVGTAKGTIRVGSHRLCLVAPTNGAISSWLKATAVAIALHSCTMLSRASSWSTNRAQRAGWGTRAPSRCTRRGTPSWRSKLVSPKHCSCLCGANCLLVLTPL